MLRKTVLNLLFKLYGIRRQRFRHYILKFVKKLDGGEFYSSVLRKIYSHYHQIEIGLYSYGSCFDIGNIRPLTKIGRYCSFANGVCIFNANHPINHKSTHPFFYAPELGYVESEQISRRSIEIGNDVWVGQNAIILPSVKRIGDGVVIGAGSVVIKDVPDFAVVAGNPAKVIKYRFDEEKRISIMLSGWWDKNVDELVVDCQAFTKPYVKSV